jgi:hypothetical protein
MAYPNKINTLTTVQASQTLAAGGHAQRHNDANEALEEIRDFLGSGSPGYVLTASPGASGSVAWAANSTDVLVDAKGDLIVGITDDLVDRLPVGVDGYVLTASAGASAGVAWAPDSTGSVVDAKGDLIVGTADDVIDRLPVGADGTFLSASAGASAGVVWVAPDFISETVVDAKGDLLVGSADDVVSILPVGPNSYVLTASAGASAGIVWAPSAGGGGGASITTASAAPVGPANGDAWYNTTDGALYIYYDDGDSQQWVMVVGGPVGGVFDLRTFEFTASASQTVFTGLDDNSKSLIFNTGDLLVSLNGAILTPGNDYTTSGGDTITLVTGASDQDILVALSFSGPSTKPEAGLESAFLLMGG